MCSTFVCPEISLTLLNGSLDPDLFSLNNLHLVENGNLELAESIFSLIETSDNVKQNNHIQFNNSYKMVVSFEPVLVCVHERHLFFFISIRENSLQPQLCLAF